jgi:hypothetical protein
MMDEVLGRTSAIEPAAAARFAQPPQGGFERVPLRFRR